MPGRVAPAAARSSFRHNLVAWSFALPFLILFLVFMLGPLLASLAMSFTDMKGARDVHNPLSVNFVGLDNFARLVGDETFQHAVLNTAYFVVIGIPLTLALGLLAAVAVNQGVVRFRAVFRVGYYLPVVTSIVAIAVVWRLLLSDVGLVNRLLAVVGINGPDWLNSTSTAMPSLIVMAAWRNMGFLMVIFLAGLQGIPAMLYEAASIDGASAWQRFTQITLPLLRPTLLFAAVITSIGYLQFFEEPFVMTQGGPLDSTLSVTFHIYNQFSFGNYSYAAAMSYSLFVAIVGLTLLQFRLLRSS
jgi:multiple sugar transport system permease protein